MSTSATKAPPIQKLTVHIRIRRFNPEKDKAPYWGDYTLTEVLPNDSVLDVLHKVKWTQDGTLALRRSCAHGVCGSDALRINGANMLACKTLVGRMADSSHTVKLQVEPILGLKVLKDLIVDMEPFFEHYRSVMPYFVNDTPPPADGRERLQSPEDRARFDDTTKCILCAACTTSCPSFWANGKYVGPAAIVQAHRFIYDSRDQAYAQRLNILAEEFGVWRCRTIFNCTNACPREIEVTKAIAEVKRSIGTGKV
ncbi:MAG: succinate dehydrogenase iron-sulfur subunit [Ardenticatenaceae bacterium]|nr:succinate dehydrogenase iron-sulfur subunit [Anaerolineales bacterium]MCB8917169.1 succinate dehydrogenase iron-sulfur subunit [Ardenticatenaceae bacterium]